MFKLSRNVLLVILLIALLIVPAYGESDKIEHPIIFISVGGPISEYLYLIELLERARVIADLADDLNALLMVSHPLSYQNFNWSLGKIESGKYKTAIFVFGIICSEYEDSGGHRRLTDVDIIIREFKKQIDFCTQNGIKMIGFQLFLNKNYLAYKSDTIKVIKEIVPHMDSLMVLRNSVDWPELGDILVEVGEGNGIPIEYLASSKLSNDYVPLLIQEVSMWFGK